MNYVYFTYPFIMGMLQKYVVLADYEQILG